MQANVEMEELEAVKKAAKESEDGVFVQVEGVHHVKEASVGKLLRGYQLMNRTTNVPQPGFLLVYGCSFNYCSIWSFCFHTNLLCRKFKCKIAASSL